MWMMHAMLCMILCMLVTLWISQCRVTSTRSVLDITHRRLDSTRLCMTHIICMMSLMSFFFIVRCNCTCSHVHTLRACLHTLHTHNLHHRYRDSTCMHVVLIWASRVDLRTYLCMQQRGRHIFSMATTSFFLFAGTGKKR